MSKLRSVNTQFWSDPWVEELTPSEKLLYLYFVTNEKTNMLGVYELSIRKISFETGIDSKTVKKALESFERIGKVKYTKNYIVLLNFAKHQNYNTNMKKSAIDTYNNLPKELKHSDVDIEKDNPLKGFERVLNCLGMVRKIEIETEIEEEEEKDKINFDYDQYLKFINDTLGRQLRVVCDKTKKEIPKRLKEGYTKKQIQNAIVNVKNVQNHIDSNYRHCTPEFFSRAKTLQQYSDEPKTGSNTYQLID